MEEAKNQKCPRCKSYKSPDQFLLLGRALKTCNDCRVRAAKYRKQAKCPHDRRKSTCKDCGGSSICVHNRRKSECKECCDPIPVTIQLWLRNSRGADKKSHRFDPDNFIDTDFLRGLTEDYQCCYYKDCKVKLQYVDYQDDLCTIERINNNVGHIKSNCVLACFRCNNMKKSKATTI